MALQIIGKIKQIGNVVAIPMKNGTSYNKREMVLDCTHYDPYTGEPYENFVKFEFGGNRCDELNKYKVGDDVMVSFRLQGKAYADKTTGQQSYFTTVVGYKCEPFVRGGQQPAMQPVNNQQMQYQQVPEQMPPIAPPNNNDAPPFYAPPF